ncbi:YnfA family protein [Sorangium sp. So ce834]
MGRVARNVLHDELRKKHDAVLPVDELELASVEEEDVDCWCVLVQAERLKPDDALILKRVIVDGMAVKDVAADLGVTPGNAMVRLHRARRALRDRLKEHCGTTSARSCSECGCDERGCCVTLLRARGLFVITALAEIVGCYLPYLWLRQGKSALLLLPASASLVAFAWLLTLHPTGAGRTYAAYGGIYVLVSLLWLWVIEGQRPTRWDILGGAVTIAGMAIIVLGARSR